MAGKGYFRRLGLLLALLAVLVAAAVIIPIVRKTIDAKNAPRTSIFTLKEDAVTKFRLIYGGQDITVEKKKNAWWITDPVRYAADPMEALANIKNFNSMAIRAAITNRTLVTNYGLHEPRMRFSVWEGLREHILEAGAPAFDGEGMYVREGGDIFVVEGIFVEALKKSVNDLRMKDFLAVASRDVMSLSIGTMWFKRQSRTNWTASFPGALDLDAVFTLVQEIEGMRATGFTPDGARASDYGIPERAIRVQMTLEDKSKRDFYVAGDGRNAFAKRADEDTVYRIDPAVHAALGQSASFYLRKPGASNR